MSLVWSYTKATQVGTSHIKRNEGCQDNAFVYSLRGFKSKFGPPLLAAVADGAGSSKFSAEGSRFVLSNLKAEICRTLATRRTDLTSDLLRSAVSITSARLDQFASKRGHRVRDYACTIVCVLVTDDSAWHIQIGDGAAVFRYGENRIVNYWPAKGAYGNETYFITDESFLDHLHIQKNDVPDELTLFTDGLESIALDLKSHQPYRAFFESFYRILTQRKVGFQLDLAEKLAEWMQSKLVNDRTDDDKSLVLVARSQC